jgi:cleavage and polyadenylation specificity factor subunit 1
MLDFDPAGECRRSAVNRVVTEELDAESLNGERLLLRTEYHMGAPVTVSKTIARRRTAEEEFAPQSQLVYGTTNALSSGYTYADPTQARLTGP